MERLGRTADYETETPVKSRSTARDERDVGVTNVTRVMRV